MENVIYRYSLNDALADGVLCQIGMRGPQPIVATAAVMQDLPIEEVRQVVEAFVAWQRYVEPGLIEEERLFKVKASNEELVWVIDDGAAVTVLYPRDY